MQGSFVFALIIALFAAVSLFTWLVARGVTKHRKAQFEARPDGDIRIMDRRSSKSDTEMPETVAFWGKWCTIGFTAFAAVLVLASSFWIVGTQNVGVVTSFGRPTAVLGNGPGWTAPWDVVHEVDYSVQVTDFTASGCEIQVRLADGQTACPKVGVRWQINKAAADSLFRRYKGSTAGVENGVLIPALQKYTNIVFGDYDPVKLLSSKTPVGDPGNPSIPQLADQVERQMKAAIGTEVQIDLLNIPNIAYSQNVQDRINAILAQKAQTLIAQQSEQTASAQAAANRTISASVTHDPNVLTSRCLDLMQEIIKNNQVPPINMCNLSGSGSGVIVNAGK